MPTWVRRVRGVLGMGFVWAIGGACVGGVIELIDNVLPGSLPFVSRVDMWPQTLAIPGFISGVLFACTLMLASRPIRRRVEAAPTPSSPLSFGRFAAVGAVAGVLLGALAMGIGAPLLFVGVTTVWGVAAASGSYFFARRSMARELIASDDEPPTALPGSRASEPPR
jgi:hypothetical protein